MKQVLKGRHFANIAGIQWWPWTAFLLKILGSVSSSGSIAGIAAASHEDSTLKGNKVSNLYEYFK
jgi:hypothetical protein